jgi:exodeoxyribonuclease VII small subunit
MPAKKKPSPAPVAASFEEAADELEEITRRLEDEPSSLEKLLEDFERGQALLSYCQKTLRSARERLELVEADLSKETLDESADPSPKPDFSDHDDDVRLF